MFETTTMEETILENLEDHDMEKPQEHVETPHKKNSHKRKPTWAQELLQDAERYGAPDGMHKERKIPKQYNNDLALLCDIINKEHSNYKEAAENKEWKDTMIKEYQLIMKNDV